MHRVTALRDRLLVPRLDTEVSAEPTFFTQRRVRKPRRRITAPGSDRSSALPLGCESETEIEGSTTRSRLPPPLQDCGAARRPLHPTVEDRTAPADHQSVKRISMPPYSPLVRILTKNRPTPHSRHSRRPARGRDRVRRYNGRELSFLLLPPPQRAPSLSARHVRTRPWERGVSKSAQPDEPSNRIQVGDTRSSQS